MRNYDFHELLDDYQFQNFGAKFVEIREGVKIFCNSKAKDGGIDFYDINHKIMGQVKCYQNNFNSFKNSLKDEVKKVKKEKPEKYILVTSVACSKERKQQLLEMFDGYLKEEDIIDKNELNNLLSDKKYNKLEIEFLNLLVPNSFVLFNTIDKIVHKNIYTQTELEKKDIQEVRKTFAINDFFYEVLEQLLKDRVIIISGEPGVGKTTLARMLCTYINNKHKDIEFVAINSINDLYEIYDSEKSQIYFYDDFWGDIKKEFNVTSKEQERLYNFIKSVNTSNNKWLVMTTREYVFQEGINTNNKFNSKYSVFKKNLELSKISSIEKFRILKNHVINNNLPFEHAKKLLNEWDSITNNINYNPRIIETYLENYDRDIDKEKLYNDFIDYLNCPFEYWKNILDKQTIDIKIMLLLLALNGKMTLNVLSHKTLNVIKNNNLIMIYKDSSINVSIKEIDDTFITINRVENSTIVSLKNPSYKDFLILYLKANFVELGQILIDEVSNIDGLLYLLDALNSNYEEIFLPSLKKLSNKILSMLEIKFKDKDKLRCLYNLVITIDFNKNIELKNYIIDYFKQITLNFDQEIVYTDYLNYDFYFVIVEALNKRVDLREIIDPYAIISDYFWFTNEYIDSLSLINTWLGFKTIFKVEFLEFVKNNKKEIKETIYWSAIELAENFVKEKNIEEIDFLTYEILEDIYQGLNIKYPIGLKNKLEEMYFSIDIKQVDKSETYDINSSNLSIVETQNNFEIIDNELFELFGDEDEIYYADFNNYLLTLNLDKDIKETIQKIRKSYDNPINIMLYHKSSLNILIDYIKNVKNASNTLYSELSIPMIINYLYDNDKNIYNNYFYIILFGTYLVKSGIYIFSLEEFSNFMKLFNLSENIIQNILSTKLFVKQGNWYKFSSVLFLTHIIMNNYKTQFIKEDQCYVFHTLINILPDIIYNNFSNRINFYNLLSRYDKEAWDSYIVMPEFKNFVRNIDKTNETSIVIDFLKQFNLVYKYSEINGCNGKYDCLLVTDLIYMRTNILIPDFFDFTGNDDSLQDFLSTFFDKQEFIVNDYLNSKKFIRILKENGIIEKINDIFNDIENVILINS